MKALAESSSPKAAATQARRESAAAARPLPVGRQQLTIPEAAAHLRMSETEVRKLIADGKLRAVDVGEGLGFLRVPFREFTAFMGGQKRSSARRAKLPQDVLGHVSITRASENTPKPRQCAAVTGPANRQPAQNKRANAPVALRKNRGGRK